MPTFIPEPAIAITPFKPKIYYVRRSERWCSGWIGRDRTGDFKYPGVPDVNHQIWNHMHSSTAQVMRLLGSEMRWASQRRIEWLSQTVGSLWNAAVRQAEQRRGNLESARLQHAARTPVRMAATRVVAIAGKLPGPCVVTKSRELLPKKCCLALPVISLKLWSRKRAPSFKRKQ